MGSGKAYVPIEETRVFQQFLGIAGKCWEAAISWPNFARDTLGKQLVRAIDSVGANLAEGDGRYRDADALHFFVTARASAREAQYWIQLAVARGLLKPSEAQELLTVMERASKELNALITYRRNHLNVGRTKEIEAEYVVDNGERLDGKDD
jgi:four helix bundle protein